MKAGFITIAGANSFKPNQWSMSEKVRFRLRAYSIDDLDMLVKYANNPKIASNLTDMFPHPYKKEDGEKFIKMASQHDPLQIFAIDIDGNASGAIGIHPQTDIHRRNAELGYWLAEPFWGKGIITEAIKQMVKYAFKNFEIDRIFARPFGKNTASQRVLEKAGFELEARFKNIVIKNGVYEDELVYAVRN
jgi:RimJ/RimL family protein N-acetyltransferase